MGSLIRDVKNLHHAYFIGGIRAHALRRITSFVEKNLRIKITGNPDFFLREYETFGIDDARELKERAGKRPLEETKKIFIIAFNFITSEAQNALLKMFEEPAEDTHFFIVAPVSAALLPTLRSRLSILEPEVSKDELTEARKFLSGNLNLRLKIAEKFKDAENESKKSELLFLIDQLERFLSENNKSSEASQADALKEMLALKKYLFGRSPSVKMIAEYLLLRLPKIKNNL
jgi:DNA polymerase III delta prime subunit